MNTALTNQTSLFTVQLVDCAADHLNMPNLASPHNHLVDSVASDTTLYSVGPTTSNSTVCPIQLSLTYPDGTAYTTPNQPNVIIRNTGSANETVLQGNAIGNVTLVWKVQIGYKIRNSSSFFVSLACQDIIGNNAGQCLDTQTYVQSSLLPL